MAQLYVLGGKQRQLTLKQEEEWNLYESALLLKVDTESGAVQVCVEYKTPVAARVTRIRRTMAFHLRTHRSSGLRST